MSPRSAIVCTAACALLLVGGCGDDCYDDPRVPNPAVAYCEQRGGRVTGPEPMCELPDGSIVDAWEFYRAESGDGAITELCVDLAVTQPGAAAPSVPAAGSVLDGGDHLRGEEREN